MPVWANGVQRVKKIWPLKTDITWLISADTNSQKQLLLLRTGCLIKKK